MKQELTWGTAATLAIVAAVGISSQSGSKPSAKAVSTAERPAVAASAKAKVATKSVSEKVEAQCEDSVSLLERFFLKSPIVGPESCYAPGKQPMAGPLDATLQPDFIIATFPDPLHTHFSLLFDRFIEALQQGFQDEGYQYDSSWLPWETDEPSFALLKDQEDADDRKSKREDQPGILLFRNGDSQYQHALIVFIVGEEPTRGIHRPQFEHAIDWINVLQLGHSQGLSAAYPRTSVAILGPTFSGSFPSLTQLLKTDGVRQLNAGSGFSIYSGSASSRDDGRSFAKTTGVHFRSLVQDDETALSRFCRYVERTTKRGTSGLAILSEDETAYGNIVTRVDTDSRNPKEANRKLQTICPDATNIYYPRDISTLRAAYQTQSMFSSGSTQSSSDNSGRKSLPTDLADPSGNQHDTVRTYAGNQTPLSQEAQLLGIVDVLRAHRAEYILIRSSNTLDPLFLANFLRRDYPEARLVLVNSDLLFQRGQDAMALSGVMTLSTYPMFSWAREWTALPSQDLHSHRVFPENSSEGTYIASRLLLQSLAAANHRTPSLYCQFVDTDGHTPETFAPPVSCAIGKLAPYAPLPDYAPPYWMNTKACDVGSSDGDCKPATWLSVITRNGTWPLAVLNEHTLITPVGDYQPPKDPAASSNVNDSPEHPRWPTTPRSTKIMLVALCCLALFHTLCCRFPSFTAKPAFRAHFATPDMRHTWLVMIGSYLIVLMALFAGWGCGIFSYAQGPPTGSETSPVWAVVISVCIAAAFAMIANIIVTRKLNGYGTKTGISSTIRIIVAVLFFFLLVWAFFGYVAHPLEDALSLASRAFAYWRSMNPTSGVSPIVPFLSLAVGLYFWVWYALHGLALFGPDRPCLPRQENLEVELPINHGRILKLSMFSREKAGDPAERKAYPLAAGNLIMVVALFATVFALENLLMGDVPIRSLGARRYALIFCFALDFYFSMILTEAWQIWRTWSCVRQLLVFLDRLALRRTLSALHGFSWGSVWRMSGNVLDVRYKLLSRQLECLTHLRTSLRLFKTPADPEEVAAFANVSLCKTTVEECQKVGVEFAEWYSDHYNNPEAADLQKFQAFQQKVAYTTGVVLSKLLVPVARVEKRSLIQLAPDDKPADDRKGPRPSKNGLIRNAEELVCLTYLGFAQNLLGRIRTIVLGGVYLFIALCIAVSSYPFDPRTLLSGLLLFLFVAFGGIVVFTYADMHRDTTLSYLTNTNPGELGSEFWFKMVGFVAAPLLGLITQIFPEWSGFLFSWLQPGLSSLK